MTPKLPPSPKSIPAGRWRKTRRELIESLDSPSRLDVELIDRLILNLIEAEAALKSAQKLPTHVGPSGNPVEHPGFRIAARCESTALAIANRLGVFDVRKHESTETSPRDEVEDELAAIRKRKTAG